MYILQIHYYFYLINVFMMNKKLLWVASIALAIATLGAQYVISGADLNGVATASSDMAASLVGNLAKLLPTLIPVLVVGFIIALVVGIIKRR